MDFDLVDIAIIGGGIGGAAAALALRQAGLDVHVFEQASELKEVGGGIVVREPSRALLAQWGVLDELKPKLARVENLEILLKTGVVLHTAPAGMEGGETHCAHRADVHTALVSRTASDRIHLGHRLAQIRDKDDYAEALFENGRGVRARLLIGADGLRSVVRTLIDATPMTYLKQVTNRFIAPASLLSPDLPNDRIRVWQAGDLGEVDRRIIMLPIRGGSEVTINAAIPADTAPALWGSMPADDLLALFTDFHPTITSLIEGRTVPITTHALYDKEPIAQWAGRHIVLLGDAAHPMSPMNGQGANQAMQDAGALAAALEGLQWDDLASALDRYQSIRGPATAHIQMMSRKAPPSFAKPQNSRGGAV